MFSCTSDSRCRIGFCFLKITLTPREHFLFRLNSHDDDGGHNEVLSFVENGCDALSS